MDLNDQNFIPLKDFNFWGLDKRSEQPFIDMRPLNKEAALKVTKVEYEISSKQNDGVLSSELYSFEERISLGEIADFSVKADVLKQWLLAQIPDLDVDVIWWYSQQHVVVGKCRAICNYLYEFTQGQHFSMWPLNEMWFIEYYPDFSVFGWRKQKPLYNNFTVNRNEPHPKIDLLIDRLIMNGYKERYRTHTELVALGNVAIEPLIEVLPKIETEKQYLILDVLAEIINASIENNIESSHVEKVTEILLKMEASMELDNSQTALSIIKAIGLTRNLKAVKPLLALLTTNNVDDSLKDEVKRALQRISTRNIKQFSEIINDTTFTEIERVQVISILNFLAQPKYLTELKNEIEKELTVDFRQTLLNIINSLEKVSCQKSQVPHYVALHSLDILTKSFALELGIDNGSTLGNALESSNTID